MAGAAGILNNLKKRTDFAFLLFRQVNPLRYHDIKHYSAIVGAFRGTDQKKQLGPLFRELISSNEHAHVEDSVLLKSLPKRDNLEDAVVVLKEMEETGVTPSAITYKTLVEELCLLGKARSGYEMLQTCREKGVLVDVSCYHAVIRGYCNETKLQEAEHVLQDMRKHGMTPNAHIYASLIHGYCKSNNIARALSLHDEMLSEGIKTNCIVLNSILQCWCEMDMDVQTIEQFQRFKNSGRMKWGLSLMLSLAVHDFKEMDLHMRQLSYSGIADTYLEAKKRSRRSST